MSEPEGDESLSSFKRADIEQQDASRLATVLDIIAGKPAVQALKAWALDALRPGPGDSALDVGCGTGEDVVALAGKVGPGGRAVGIEPSPGLRAEAARRTNAAIEVLDGDAHALPFEDATFDVVRCERVLQHLADPAGAVAEMARVVKPGGRIALLDTDWQTAIVYPADADVLARMIGNFLAQSANPYSGRQLRSLLAGAGLAIHDDSASTWVEPQSGATEGFAMMLSATALAAGAVTNDEADRFNEGLAAAAASGAFHLSVTMFGVVAAKPAVR